MSDLAALQARFQAGVLTAGDDAALADINGSSRETAPVLFGVYRYAYAARLVEVLQGNFDVTWSLLGDAGFDAAARAFIADSPSRVRNARWFGEGFAAFLARHRSETPAVGDVAALDWAIAGAFDAADSPVIGADALAALHPGDWPGMRLILRPSVRRVPVTTPAAAVHEALSAGQAPPPLAAGEPHTVLVWRHGLTVRYRPMPADEDAALAILESGGTFAELCDAVTEITGAETAASRAVELLSHWLISEMIAGFAIGE